MCSSFRPIVHCMCEETTVGSPQPPPATTGPEFAALCPGPGQRLAGACALLCETSSRSTLLRQSSPRMASNGTSMSAAVYLPRNKALMLFRSWNDWFNHGGPLLPEGDTEHRPMESVREALHVTYGILLRNGRLRHVVAARGRFRDLTTGRCCSGPGTASGKGPCPRRRLLTCTHRPDTPAGGLEVSAPRREYTGHATVPGRRSRVRPVPCA